MTNHPAIYTDALLPVMAGLLPKSAVSPRLCRDGGHGPATLRVLDPFAGTGKIARLHAWLPQAEFFGYEIEPEWADQARTAGCNTTTGDSRHMHYPAATFDAICTSPTYGNRMADHHEARERCKTCYGMPLWCSRHKIGLHAPNHIRTQECNNYLSSTLYIF